MRCATCGTENAPDSRFCGGCGAKQPGSEPPRVAPTHKITDDARYPQPASPSTSVRPQGPVSYAPPSIPPTVSTPPPGSVKASVSQPPSPYAVAPSVNRPPSQQPKSNPPTSNPPTSQQPPVATRPTPQASSASGSFVVPPRRPVGLMVVVLLVDLGLAATGGVLLSKGLASKDEKKSEPKSEPAPVEKKSELEPRPPAPVAPAAAAAPTPAASAVFAAAPAPEPKPNVAARESPKRDKAATRPTGDVKAADAKPAASTPVTKLDEKPVTKPDEKPVTKPAEQKGDAEVVANVPTQPQDPYQAPNTEQEIDAAAARSSATFARCAADQSAHGSIKIAFQVRYDGRVINAAAVENTTNNADLARCLVTEISSWHVSAHNGTTINMLRPFTYP